MSRVLAGIFGSYALAWGFVASGAMFGFACGLSLDEARRLASMLGLLVYLGAFCWSFVAASVLRIWLWLLGAGALLTFAGALAARAMHA